ncbi:TRAP transporter substrate-binding protein DctP [Saccharospirillum sp. HFRX-1]|uniref:TRAP transporter substrate-binding protein DctP n=1 Tax=unclassified Saccharospirillum TaxID=2633430 RepID=UPI0037243C58
MRALLSSLLALSFVASAQAVELKIATQYPPGSVAVTSLNALADDLSNATGGELELKLYPSGVMGNDPTVLRKIRVGQLHGALVSSSTLSLLDVQADGISQPFQFDSLDAVDTARDQFDPRIRAQLNEQGWYGFGPLDGGFAYLMSQQPVDGMAGLQASKLWLPDTPTVRDISNSVAIDFAVLGVGDVLAALETGAIDALIAPPAAALTLNWHSRLDYLTDQPVVYTWGMLILPERAVARLSDTQREALFSRLDRWASELDAQMRQSNASARTALLSLLTPVAFAPAELTELRQQLPTP